jgi:transcriptional regulator with XRE-family HTH domain
VTKSLPLYPDEERENMLSEALRLIRVYHDMKQQELADRLGLSKSYVSEMEKGKKVPSMEVIQKYSNAFGIPASSILFFSENLENPSKATRAKTAIAGKVMQFLQLIEAKTADGET